MSWVDWLIILFVIWGLVQGFWRGFLSQAFVFIALVLALGASLWLFPPLGDWFESQVHLPISFARPLALAVVFIVAFTVFRILSTLIQKFVLPFLNANPINKALGAVLGGVQKLVLIGFILTLLVTLPIPASAKASIDNSRFGHSLIHSSLGLEDYIGSKINTDQLQSIATRTVGTNDNTTISLNYTVANPSPDLQGEAEMFALTNEVRQKENKPLLKINNDLRLVAEAHARDMLQKGYFSHLSPPNGEDVLGRVKDAHITVTSVGENLANAPTTELAQVGLMASPGHRANILSTDYTEVGIGVLDAGTHGKMVVEVFAKTY